MAAPQRNLRGFTLIELMVTLVIMAILVAFALPNFRDLLRRNQVASASNALLASLSYARTEAITRGQLVSICPSSDGEACTAGGTAFDPGWLVYSYPAGAASANLAYNATGATLLRANGAQRSVSIKSLGSTVITFGQQGQLKPNTPLAFVTCFRSASSGDGAATDAVSGTQLDVNGSGSVTSKSTAVCTPP
ncbi:MAG: GspH/FimT family pseudopilin [Rhodanobacter sp.]